MRPSPGPFPQRARLAASAVHLPSRHRTMAQTRQRLIDRGSPYVPPPGLLEELTGVRRVHEKEEGQQVSDLAVAACGKALAEAEAGVDEVDLLLFASSSQDLIEPATGHVVAAKLGAGCPVFDVKNACNSVLNAIEVASAFIASGRHRTVLIACGEAGTLVTRWQVPDREEFTRCLPGYTVSDAGAALLLTAGPAGEEDPGVLDLAFGSDSAAWQACTVAGGGTLHGRRNDWEVTSLRLGGNQLRDAAVGCLPLVLAHPGLLERVRASAFIAMHQISRPTFDELVDGLGLPPERCLPTIVEHGNAASASLPLQLVRARESGLVEPGDTVALIGLASGFSIGLALIRL